MQFHRYEAPTHPTYTHMHDAAVTAAAEFTAGGWEFDRVVGLARGGLFPAMLISHVLDIPMTAIHYSSKKGEGEFRMYDNEKAFDHLMHNRTERLLVVDDICDSGHTFKEVVDQLDVLKVNPVTTYAVYYKAREPVVYEPALYTYTIPEDSPWIVFPWENVDA